ncbi:MAG: hypothetical protein M0R03_14520 [Novosphingobium sp.]|nr:hypothetical protein [Novosphingobium sp.]
MANLLNHNFNFLKLKVSNFNYWDFFVNKDRVSDYTTTLTCNSNKIYDKSLVCEIDPNIEGCIEEDKDTLYSTTIWDGALSNGIELNDIGLTGLDNGFIKYDEETDSILDLFTNSEFELDKEDLRFFVNPVDGYVKDLDYSVGIEEEDFKYMSFNGGGYQGFWKIFNDSTKANAKNLYRTLPTKPSKEFAYEFLLKPRSESEIPNTMNEINPNNKGIFFYQGTRAENKFWYCTDEVTELSPDDKTFCEDVKTSTGVGLNENNLVRIHTDNKFVIFNRAKDGYTTVDFCDACCQYHKHDEECLNFDEMDFMFEYKKKSKLNYFRYFNRTKKGLTTHKVGDDCCGDYNKEQLTQEEIDLINQLYINTINNKQDFLFNSLAFRLRDDGSIGYKYFTCPDEGDDAEYKVMEEYSKPNMVCFDKWNHIVVRFIANSYIEDPECSNLQRKGKLYFYVNGYLKLVSKEMQEPFFRELNEIPEKQEAVPFNLSLGMGTQGLSEMILSELPEDITRYVLPIEENFAGSFIGDIKGFRMYSSMFDLTKIQNNYCYYKQYLSQYGLQIGETFGGCLDGTENICL